MSGSPNRRRANSRGRNRTAPRQRRGKIIVMTAFLMIMMMAMIAFGVDVGYIAVARTEIQICTDAAALAGASGLVDGTAVAQTRAQDYLTRNTVAGQTLSTSNATIDFGVWSDTTRTFTPGGSTTPNGIRINTSLNSVPLFFGKALNKNSFNVSAQSIAVYQPRDISLVLDYSGSMSYDSQFRNISLIGKTAIEANLTQMYSELGVTLGSLPATSVSYGTSSTANSTIRSHFGLNSVAYPYPAGSWNEYIDYVQTDSTLNSAGYRNKYGGITFMHYLLAMRDQYAETPVLWKTSEQPLTALKDAVDEFLSYLSQNSTDDRVSLSIYTYSDSTAILESALTKNYSQISSLVRGRQSGHYIGGTNISAGMTKGRVDLQNNARVGVSKLMVLMTDGVVNLPTGNTTLDKQAVRDEANLCAAAKIPVVTISVGALADTALMQEVADITGGVAFVVPGGQPLSDVKVQLEQVFAKVAADRPLKLVQ